MKGLGPKRPNSVYYLFPCCVKCSNIVLLDGVIHSNEPAWDDFSIYWYLVCSPHNLSSPDEYMDIAISLNWLFLS